MGIFKKLSIGSYVLALGVVLALIAMIIGITSSAKYEGFWEPTMGGVIAFTIFGIVFAAAAIALGVKFGDTFWTSAVLVIAVLFFALATCYMVMSKMNVMGTVVFSDLEGIRARRILLLRRPCKQRHLHNRDVSGGGRYVLPRGTQKRGRACGKGSVKQ